MAKISREDVLKVANISNIAVSEQEIESLIKQLDDVLTYAACVKEGARQIDNVLAESEHKNVNIMREDVVIPTAPEQILQQAPAREENYFVVPVILEHS